MRRSPWSTSPAERHVRVCGDLLHDSGGAVPVTEAGREVIASDTNQRVAGSQKDGTTDGHVEPRVGGLVRAGRQRDGRRVRPACPPWSRENESCRRRPLLTGTAPRRRWSLTDRPADRRQPPLWHQRGVSRRRRRPCLPLDPGRRRWWSGLRSRRWRRRHRRTRPVAANQAGRDYQNEKPRIRLVRHALSPLHKKAGKGGQILNGAKKATAPPTHTPSSDLPCARSRHRRGAEAEKRQDEERNRRDEPVDEADHRHHAEGRGVDDRQ